MLGRKVFELLLLVKTKVSKFIGKSFNLGPLLNTCHNAPEEPQQVSTAHLLELEGKSNI